MSEQEFQSKLAELITEASPPGGQHQKLKQLANESVQCQKQLRNTVNGLQGALDDLRCTIKYLVFDLEATRRENGYLRKMLEETGGGGYRDTD